MLEAAIVIGGVVNGPIIGIFTAGPRQPPQHHSLLQFSPILFREVVKKKCLFTVRLTVRVDPPPLIVIFSK